jgi:hypothetical protein
VAVQKAGMEALLRAMEKRAFAGKSQNIALFTFVKNMTLACFELKTNFMAYWHLCIAREAAYM